MITDTDYLCYDPFEGERDVDIRCRTVRLVVTRKPQACFGLGRSSHNHEIPVGSKARYEKALVDGEWGASYVCCVCMNSWLAECGIK